MVGSAVPLYIQSHRGPKGPSSWPARVPCYRPTATGAEHGQVCSAGLNVALCSLSKHSVTQGASPPLSQKMRVHLVRPQEWSRHRLCLRGAEAAAVAVLPWADGKHVHEPLLPLRTGLRGAGFLLVQGCPWGWYSGESPLGFPPSHHPWEVSPQQLLGKTITSLSEPGPGITGAHPRGDEKPPAWVCFISLEDVCPLLVV